MDKAERFEQLFCTPSLRTDLAGRSVRAALVTGASGAADFVLRIASTAILARLIAPDHFGLVMMVMAVIAIADQLRELGLSSATVQKPQITHAEVTNLFWVNVAVSAVLTIAVCAASPLIARYYQEPRLVVITCLFASNLLAGGLTVQHQALLTRQLRLGHAAAIRLVGSILSTALAIGLAWWDYGYWALLWREIARAVFLGLGMWLCVRWTPGLPFWKTDIRPLVRFGANLTGANILSTITAGFDRLLLGRFTGAAAVGWYRQAFQLIGAPTEQLLSPLYQVAQPALSLVQTDTGRYRRLFTKVLTFVCLLTMPLSLFVAVYATEITLLLLGSRWIEAAPILCILSLGAFIKQAVSSTAFVLITRGQGAAYLNVTVLHNVVLTIAMCVGVRWGVLGVAVADVATTYLMVVPRLRSCLVGSPVSTRDFLITLARPAIASLTMAFALLALHDAAADEAAATIALGAPVGVVSFCAVWLLLPGGRKEVTTLYHDLRDAVQRKSSRLGPRSEVLAAAHS